MSDAHLTSAGAPGAGSDQDYSALFAQLVLQQANMATMLLGKVPHPETGRVIKDIDAARLFIDELEMLEAKTKGNLTKDETALLKHSLMSLRLAFVEAVDSPAPAPPAEGGHTPAEPAQPAAGQTAPAAEEESRTKFSKKY